MARYGIYLKAEGFLIKSFGYICEGLVLVYRHFMKPQNVSCNIRKQQYNNIINKNGQAEHRIKK